MSSIVQVNLTEIDISVDVDIHLDPGAAFVETDAAPHPPVAPTTQGPHRYTIYVPHDDESIFSVGEHCATRINDTGITGRTKAHIHFETREEAKTFITLGKGSNDIAIASYDATIPKKSEGYAMVTQGVSWNESKEKYYVVSLLDDVTVRAKKKRVVLQADAGAVDVLGKKNVNVVGKTIALSAPAEPDLKDINYKGEWENEAPEMHGAETWSHATEIAAILSTSVDTLLETKHLIHHWHHDSHISKVKPLAGLAQIVATAARTVLTASHLIGELRHHEAEGSVKIGAASSVAGVAGSFMGMFGGLSATLGSGLFATMVAPYTALEGVLFSGISAKRTSVLGVIGAELSSPKGTVTIDAKKHVAIGSEGEVAIGGKEGVFVRSESKFAGVHGATKGYLAAGEGEGFGAEATTAGFRLGKISGSANKIDGASFDASHIMTLTKDSIALKNDEAMVELLSNSVKISKNSTKIEATPSQVQVTADKILLG